MIRLKFLPLILSFFAPVVYADGGSGLSCQNLIGACPSGQTGSIVYSWYGSGRGQVEGYVFDSCQNIQKAVSAGVTTSLNVRANTCVDNSPPPPPVVTPPVTPPVVTPPAEQPPVTQPPVVEPPVVTPPATVIPPTVPQVNVPANYDSLCNEGYTGKIRHVFSIYYTMETYNTVMSDGTPTTAQASTPHVSESIINECKIISTTTTKTEQGVQEQTCDSYNGAAPGTYYGTVYKYVTYTSTYSEITKSTSTSFVVNTNDVRECIPQFTDTSMERRVRSCPAGQIGEIQEYIYKAVNTRGETVYPYGTDWLLTSNSCANTQTDTALSDDTAAPPSGLLSNVSITSSDLRASDRFSKYLTELSGSGWNSSQKQKLIIEVDDLHTGSFSAAKLGSAISKFQKVVGFENAEVEIKLPRTIDKFVGASGITQQAVQNKSISMKSVKFDGHDAEVTYWEIGNGSLSTPQEKTAKVNIIPKGMGLKNISNE